MWLAEVAVRTAVHDNRHMDVHQDSALTIMATVLVILLWIAALTWIRFARHPDEQRENVGYAMAAVLGYAGLLIVYLMIIYI